MSPADLAPFAAAASLVATGCALGLYLGERGRRTDLARLLERAERAAFHGSPFGGKAEVRQPPTEPEVRLAAVGGPKGEEFQVSQATIQRAVTDFQRMCKEAGRPISREEAENQVRLMCHPDYQPGHIADAAL